MARCYWLQRSTEWLVVSSCFESTASISESVTSYPESIDSVDSVDLYPVNQLGNG